MPQKSIVRDLILLWGCLVAVGLACRPLTPVDETRAVTVAFEMWQRGDFLVPHLNGETYSHKPPLLQWGIHMGWLIAGLNDLTPRLVAPLFALANLFLTAALARRLWPQQPTVAALAPLVLLGFPVWALWTSLTLYDMLVTFFTLLGLWGVALSAGGARRGWLLTGLAVGGGVLSKGPVILLFILPAGLCAPWWLEERPAWGWARWYLELAGAVLVGALLALAWALPAGQSGGEAYRHAIFWGQSAGRIANSFAHQRPWWWYGAILPLLLFPWLFRISLWRSRALPGLDRGLRFCLAHMGAVTLLLSLISAKQAHYALPILPAAALACGRLLAAESPRYARWDRCLLGGLVLLLALGLSLLPWLREVLGVSGDGGLPAAISRQAPAAAKLLLFAVGALLCLWHPPAAENSVRLTAYGLAGVLVAAHLIYQAVARPWDDLRPMAERLAGLQARGIDIAHWHKYSGEFQFLGRLTRPLAVLETEPELRDWLARHPEGYVLIGYREAKRLPETDAEFAQPYRTSRRIGLWRGSVLAAEPVLTAKLID